MATCRDTIKGALKKLSVLPIGREPSSAEAEDALEVLQSLYLELVGQGVFGRLNDVLVEQLTYSARENERVVCNNAAGVTVTLPDTITSELLGASYPYSGYYYGYSGGLDYGRGYASPDPLPRPPRDGSIITVSDVLSDLNLTWIYDGPNARWTSLDSLALSGTAPLSNRYGDALKAILAVRLAPNYNVEPSSTVIGQANTGRHALSMRWDRSARPVQASYF